MCIRDRHTRDVNESLRFSLAADSLVLYTNAGYKLSCGIAGLMLLATLLEFVYTLVIYLGGGKPIEGWTTTMLVDVYKRQCQYSSH